jgi:hypothetical protein
MSSQRRTIARGIKRNPEPSKLALAKLAELKDQTIGKA